MKQNLKALIPILILCILVFTSCTNTQDVPGDTDLQADDISGTFVGEAQGMNDLIQVQVTLEKSKIANIEILDHNESPGISDLAIASLPEKIIETQSTMVDAISGSTITSNAIMEAVKNALVNAGVDISNYNKAVSENDQSHSDEVIETEIVVVGGGGAGLTAAISAKQNGAEVLVLEKMPRLGGNTLICGALMNAYDPSRLEKAGLRDLTVEDYIEWTYEGGNKQGLMPLIETMASKSQETLEWLENDIGVEFYEDLDPYSLPWGHMPKAPLGTGFINPFIETMERLGVEAMLNTTVEEILMEDGKAIGVRAKTKSGNNLTVLASKGVILASGGMGANIELIKTYDSRYDNITMTTNHIGATGDGYLMAEKAGAKLINLDTMQTVHFAHPENGQVEYGIDTANTILINKEGIRFMKEGMKRDDSVAELQKQPDLIMFSIGDSQDWPSEDTITSFGLTIGKVLSDKKAYKADTLEELAEMIGVSPQSLVNTVTEYNNMIDQGEDTLFGREDMATRNKIEIAPFYAGPMTAAFHYTNGGIEINTKGQVISVDNEIIPNLYAAGEVTGGVMGTNRMGGNAITDIMVFGRIAGISAATNN